MTAPPNAATAIDQHTFDRLRKTIYDTSGIALQDGKRGLVAARLRQRVQLLGLSGFTEYADHIATHPNGEELEHLLNAISTNVTWFGREQEHFGIVAEAFRSWIAEDRRRLRVWSAGCSSGEEPYTLAMTLLEAQSPGVNIDARVLATDISTAILERAQLGVYPAEKVDSLPAGMRKRYTETRRGADSIQVAMRQSVRDLILFRYLNLIDLPLPLSGPLDLIMCRNVMIYFDIATRQRIVAEFERLIRPGGYLVVSHSESLVGVDAAFEMIEPSVYRRIDSDPKDKT